MNPLIQKRHQILAQMERIQRMERGSLQSETRPSLRQTGQNRGPYYKHQIWEHGRNLTRRVSSKEVEALSRAINGRKEFERLAQQFIEVTVLLTRGEMPAEQNRSNG